MHGPWQIINVNATYFYMYIHNIDNKESADFLRDLSYL